MADYTLHVPSQRYEQYTAKMQSLKKCLDILRRYRVLLIAVGTAVLTVTVCFLLMAGCFVGAAKCGDFFYGEEPSCSMTAILSKVRYQYATIGEDAVWSDSMPTEPGLYRIRAVSKNIFGVKRFSKEMTANLLPRKLSARISDTEYIYGNFSEAFIAEYMEIEGLAPGDLIFNMEYTLEGSQHAGYRVEVAQLQVHNASGEDVSACYVLETEGASFTVVPRPVTVKVDSQEKVYDAEPWEAVAVTAVEGTIVPGDRLLASCKEPPVETGSYSVQPQCRILNAEGEDVSSCYDITVMAGTLQITPRPITIRTGSSEKVYDETPLSNTEWTILSGEMVADHFLKGGGWLGLVDKGSVSNTRTFRVMNGQGEDVTHNYVLTVEPGTLTVHPIVLRYRIDDCEWTYGDEHRFINFKCISGTVVKGHKLTDQMGLQLDAGVHQAKLFITVLNRAGEDVTNKGYEIEVEGGTLTVHKRPITITSGSAEKLYDGRWLKCETYAITEGTLGQYLGQNDVIQLIDFTGEQRQVGSSDNYFTVQQINHGSRDVTQNYEITYKYGTLTVLDNPNFSGGTGDASGGGTGDASGGETGNGSGGGTGDASGGGIDGGPSDGTGNSPSGGTGNGSNGGGAGKGLGDPNDGTTVGYPGDSEKVYAAIDGIEGLDKPSLFYFRYTSYGDYNGSGWDAPKTCNTIDGMSPLSYVGRMLKNRAKKGVSMNIQRYDDCPVITPYYLDEYFYTGDDCYFKMGDSDYSVTCYQENNYIDLVGRKTDAPQECDYREFVYQNYLQIPSQTKEQLLEWAKEQGIAANSPTLVQDIQYAVQSAATYNKQGREYPAGVDVAVYFFTEAKEGICQHFATAGTMLYRAYGIPARYTVGFAATLQPHSKTELTDKMAHAWVEIYLDGLGWVPIEVTGESQQDKTELYIKACSVTKYYDGKAFEAYDLGQGNIINRRLKPGYRLEVTCQANVLSAEPGNYKNIIKSCKVYDDNGKDVSDQYSFTCIDGELKILKRRITVTTGSATQTYDPDSPLSCGDYWISEGNLVPGDRLTVDIDVVHDGSGTVKNTVSGSVIEREISPGVWENVTEGYYIYWDYGELKSIIPEN